LTTAEALEKIYESLANDNLELDAAIKDLKAALAAEGLKEAVVEPTRLAQNNRQGRKLMQSYFKKKGVTVTFAA
jgi:exonuclease VII small subunit